MAMAMRLVLIAAAIGLAAGGTWAREVDYDFVVCTHGRGVMLEASADIVGVGAESWGIVATSTTKDWENATQHCVGYQRIMAGKLVGKGLCKWFFMSGDTAIGEWDMPENGQNTFRWLSGTGGLKGITTVTSNFTTVGMGKPADQGTSQACRRDWGRFALP
jgi:hypothetical protein